MDAILEAILLAADCLIRHRRYLDPKAQKIEQRKT